MVSTLKLSYGLVCLNIEPLLQIKKNNLNSKAKQDYISYPFGRYFYLFKQKITKFW